MHKKYFVSNENDFYDDQYLGYKIHETKVDDELINELKACLSYDSLYRIFMERKELIKSVFFK